MPGGEEPDHRRARLGAIAAPPRLQRHQAQADRRPAARHRARRAAPRHVALRPRPGRRLHQRREEPLGRGVADVAGLRQILDAARARADAQKRPVELPGHDARKWATASNSRSTRSSPTAPFATRCRSASTCSARTARPSTHDAAQDGPGSYRAAFDLPAEGTSIFSVSSPDLPDGGYVFGHTRSYPREFLRTETNEPLLRTLATLGRGKVLTLARRNLHPPAGRRLRSTANLTNDFLIAALLLLPLDIWLRRRTWRAS